MQHNDHVEITKLNLALFDGVRQTILGHAVTLNHHIIRSIQAVDLEQLLIQYARLLRTAYEAEINAHKDWYRSAPLPILPTVDLTDLTVRHETCTGNTRLIVNTRGLVVVRKNTDPDSTRTKALLLCDTEPRMVEATLSTFSGREIGDMISWLYNAGVGAMEENGYEAARPDRIEAAQFISDYLTSIYDPSEIGFVLPPLTTTDDRF